MAADELRPVRYETEKSAFTGWASENLAHYGTRALTEEPMKPVRETISLPQSNQQFRLDYEGYHSLGPWCTIDVYQREGTTVIVATDECDEHHNTSITNRIERVMYLAWERLGAPKPCFFIEHYRRSLPEFDLVTFDEVNGLLVCEASAWFQGRQLVAFRNPKWKRLKPGTYVRLLVGGRLE
jgi:hypothetical protein